MLVTLGVVDCDSEVVERNDLTYRNFRSEDHLRFRAYALMESYSRYASCICSLDEARRQESLN